MGTILFYAIYVVGVFFAAIGILAVGFFFRVTKNPFFIFGVMMSMALFVIIEEREQRLEAENKESLSEPSSNIEENK